MTKKEALKIIYELIIYTEEQTNGVYETEDFTDCWKAFGILKNLNERKKN